MSVSGERGTKGQQQDRANQRDRAAAGSGDRGTKSQQQDRRNTANARAAGNAAPGVKSSGDRGTLSQQQDQINMNRALARSNTAPGVGNYSKAMDDFNNLGQGFFDDPLGALGRFFGSGFGVGEIDPSTQAPKSFIDRPTASWGIDPIGAALGIGGTFAGPFGTLANSAYRVGKNLTGWQGPMIAFDGNQPVSGGFPGFGGGSGTPAGSVNTASGGGWGNSGGGTGNAGDRGYSPFRSVTPRPTQAAQQPVASSLPSTQKPPQNLYAKPWGQNYSPFGGSKWSWG